MYCDLVLDFMLLFMYTSMLLFPSVTATPFNLFFKQFLFNGARTKTTTVT